MSHSAYLGQPPATENDFYLIKGMYRAAYAFNKDSSKGYLFVPRKPADYEYNDKQASIIVGMVVAIVVMLSTTILRLALRHFKTGVRWGLDDWVLLPGVLAIICKIIFFTTVGIIKISICLFLRHGYTSLLAWTVVDLTLAVVVASLPVISALIPKAWGDITHSSRGRRTTLRHTTSKATQGESVVGRVRRNTIDSEEEGILREDRIELSFARNSKQIQSTEASQTSLRKCTDQGDMSYKACLKESMDYHHALFRCKKRTGFGTELKEDELNEII
ncbi:hypothetical protein KCU77_g2802, partial [Aureobasidium melanogenum]